MLGTRLPSGLLVVNVTPHELLFWCGATHGTVFVPSDHVINANPVIQKVEENELYALTTIRYESMESGNLYIREVRKRSPDALVVGSIITAQAYPEEVVAPVPLRQDRGGNRLKDRLNRSDRFATYLKEKN